MCVHVMKQKKCHYIGNCSFAHSLEERDVWTYMKNNSCESRAFFFLDINLVTVRFCLVLVIQDMFVTFVNVFIIFQNVELTSFSVSSQ